MTWPPCQRMTRRPACSSCTLPCGQILGQMPCYSQLKHTTDLPSHIAARNMWPHGGPPIQSGPSGAQGGAPTQSGPPGAQGVRSTGRIRVDAVRGNRRARRKTYAVRSTKRARWRSRLRRHKCRVHRSVLDHTGSQFSASCACQWYYCNAAMTRTRKYLVEVLRPSTRGSCEGGCPFLRPLCNGTSRIRPNCADLVQAGMLCFGIVEISLAGDSSCSIGAGVDAQILAQSMCSGPAARRAAAEACHRTRPLAAAWMRAFKLS
jgi:hypothetical protein